MLEQLESRVLFDGQLDTTWGTAGVLNVGGAGLQRGLGRELVAVDATHAFHDARFGDDQVIAWGNTHLIREGSFPLIVAQPDGRYVVGSPAGLQQYAPDGTLIRTFPDGSLAKTAQQERRYFALALAPNGDILLDGAMGSELVPLDPANILWQGTIRYSADGQIKEQLKDAGGWDTLPLPDGSFIAGLNHYLPGGTRDPGFTVDPEAYVGQIDSIFGYDALGRLYAHGSRYDSARNIVKSTIIRLLPNGKLDAGYGVDGVAETGIESAPLISPPSPGSDATVTPDGTVFVAVGVPVAGENRVATVRLRSDGSVDTTWGTNGLSVVDPTPGETVNGTRVLGMAVMDDGDVVVAAGNVTVRLQGTAPPATVAPEVRLEGAGKLSILGTLGNDAIVLRSLSDGRIRITANGDVHTFSKAAIKTIELAGGDGNDYIDAHELAAITAAGVQFPVTLDGGAGDDVLVGHAGADRIVGGNGNDRIHGWAGNDWLSGNAQKDRVNGGDGNDIVSGNGSRDFLIGEAGDDTITGGDQPDTIFGGDGNDSILGEGGHDRIDGGSGLDFMSGGGGDDTFFARDNELDTIVGGLAGHDRAQADQTDSVIAIEELLA